MSIIPISMPVKVSVWLRLNRFANPNAWVPMPSAKERQLSCAYIVSDMEKLYVLALSPG